MCSFVSNYPVVKLLLTSACGIQKIYNKQFSRAKIMFTFVDKSDIVTLPFDIVNLTSQGVMSPPILIGMWNIKTSHKPFLR